MSDTEDQPQEVSGEPSPDQVPDAVGRGGPAPKDPPALMDAEEYARTLGPGRRVAAFLSWGRSAEPNRRTHAEWTKAMTELMARPVR